MLILALFCFSFFQLILAFLLFPTFYAIFELCSFQLPSAFFRYILVSSDFQLVFRWFSANFGYCFCSFSSFVLLSNNVTLLCSVQLRPANFSFFLLIFVPFLNFCNQFTLFLPISAHLYPTQLFLNISAVFQLLSAAFSCFQLFKFNSVQRWNRFSFFSCFEQKWFSNKHSACVFTGIDIFSEFILTFGLEAAGWNVSNSIVCYKSGHKKTFLMMSAQKRLVLLRSPFCRCRLRAGWMGFVFCQGSDYCLDPAHVRILQELLVFFFLCGRKKETSLFWECFTSAKISLCISLHWALVSPSNVWLCWFFFSFKFSDRLSVLKNFEKLKLWADDGEVRYRTLMSWFWLFERPALSAQRCERFWPYRCVSSSSHTPSSGSAPEAVDTNTTEIRGNAPEQLDTSVSGMLWNSWTPADVRSADIDEPLDMDGEQRDRMDPSSTWGRLKRANGFFLYCFDLRFG